MMDNVLERISEERLKRRMISSLDVDKKLLERFNNGQLGVSQLEKLSYCVKMTVYEVIREHTFKME